MPKHQDKHQAEQDRKDQEAKRKAAEDAGNIPQVSSAPLKNYPDAQMPAAEPDEEEDTPEQPQTGTAATSEEKG